MRNLLMALLFVMITQQLCAQKTQVQFGKIDKEELEMMDCPFDPGAVAVTLIDWGHVFYRSGREFLNTVFEKRVRIKILKTAGLSYANVSIPYYDQNNEEQIKKIIAYTYNIDESGKIKRTRVGKNSIYSKRINKQYRVMIIPFPEAKAGSVIEYRYLMEMQSWQHMKDWYFQGSIPTRYSEYQVDIPSVFRFAIQPSVVDSMEVKEEVSDEVVRVNDVTYRLNILKKSYIMQNLPGIREEPFMGSPKDYMQRLEFQLSQVDNGDGQLINLRKDWGDIIKLLMEDNDFGVQLNQRIPGSDTILAAAARLPDMESKIRLIYNYVRRNMSWDNSEDIYSGDGIVKAWNNGYGSSADINLLLVDLLKRAGLPAFPILFSTRENGIVNSAYPFIRQFNTVMAYVRSDAKYFVLDATDRVSYFTLIPVNIVNTRGFVVKGYEGEWIDVDDITHKYKITSAVQGDIDSNGVMKGAALVNNYEYAKKQRAESWIASPEKFREDYFSKPYAPLKVDDLAVSNAASDSLPLEQKVQFTYQLNSSGSYRYFEVNLFSGMERNPFISDQRLADIDFGYTQDYMIFGSYTIPQGYAFETLPGNISMVTPDNSIVFNRFVEAEDNRLSVRITVSFKRTFYAAPVYPQFAAFYKKLIDKLNEHVVFKKKSAL